LHESIADIARFHEYKMAELEKVGLRLKAFLPVFAIQKFRELLLYLIALITLFDRLVNKTTKTDSLRQRISIAELDL